MSFSVKTIQVKRDVHKRSYRGKEVGRKIKVNGEPQPSTPWTNDFLMVDVACAQLQTILNILRVAVSNIHFKIITVQ